MHDASRDTAYTVEIDGKEVRYTASSAPESEEPFPDALKLWPDYRPLGTASVEGIKMIPGANPNRGKSYESKSAKISAVVNASGSESDWRGFGCLFFLLIVAAAIYGGYQWLDSIGWISHREDTVISVQSDWLVCESKECWSFPLDGFSAPLLKKEIGYAMSSVSCDDGPKHKMKATFYGRKVQTEYKVVTWRCTRGLISFTCYQTGGAQVYENIGAADK